MIFNSNLSIDIIKTTYHDQFGINRANKCIQLYGRTPINISIKLELL